MINEADQGIEALSIKEVTAGSLDDPKENEVCMSIFNIEESCHMVAGNMDQCSILKSMIKSKDLLPQRNVGTHGSHIH